MTPRPIETSYKGYRFRSRLEARWAVFFDAAGIPWKYETEGFDLGDGCFYLPDFYLPREDVYVEIKPGSATKVQNVYLAGKMNEWRRDFHLCGHYYVGPNKEKPHCSIVHGVTPLDFHDIAYGCFGQIEHSDIVAAWIDSLDCYGTLAEIGYARGCLGSNVHIAIGYDRKIFVRLRKKFAVETGAFYSTKELRLNKHHAMWFISEIADEWGVFGSPAEFSRSLFKWTEEEEKCRRLSNLKTCWLIEGDPYPGEYKVICFDNGFGNARGLHIVSRDESGDPADFIFERDDVGIYLSYDNEKSLMDAYRAARSARFDHGEKGAKK